MILRRKKRPPSQKKGLKKGDFEIKKDEKRQKKIKREKWTILRNKKNDD